MSLTAVHPSDSQSRDENIRAVVDLERAALASRSLAERLGDAVSRLLGSNIFLILHLVWFGLWVLAGLDLISGLPTFDPFPFAFLTLVVSLEAIFLSIFVLISQNRMARLADRRAHLDLQVNIMAEQEITTILKLVQEVRSHLGIASQQHDVEIERQLVPTDVQQLSIELDQHLPTE
jgi:uncharacterized membrane protein